MLGLYRVNVIIRVMDDNVRVSDERMGCDDDGLHHFRDFLMNLKLGLGLGLGLGSGLRTFLCTSGGTRNVVRKDMTLRSEAFHKR